MLTSFSDRGSNSGKTGPKGTRKFFKATLCGPFLEGTRCFLENVLTPFTERTTFCSFCFVSIVRRAAHEDWKQGATAASCSFKLFYHVGEGFRSAACQTLSLPRLLFVYTQVFFFPMCLNILSGKLFCRHLSDTTLSTTLIQFLGLPPSHGGGVCVSQWC